MDRKYLMLLTFVHCLANGLEVVPWVKRHSPKLIVLDEPSIAVDLWDGQRAFLPVVSDSVTSPVRFRRVMASNAHSADRRKRNPFCASGTRESQKPRRNGSI
jgi:hypothetical protein